MINICVMKRNISELFNGGTLFVQSDLPLNLIEIAMVKADSGLTYTVNDGFAHLTLNGYLFMGSDEYSASNYAEKIQEIKRNSTIKGLLFEIYSGGGIDIAGELLRSELSSLSAVKPVVAWGHYVASGAYLAALGANIIIGSNGLSRFGSIGAYIQLDKFYKEIYSFIYNDIYADASPEKNEAWRKYLTDDNVDLYKQQANETAKYFINQVKAGRHGVSDDALKGAMFTAAKAKSLGLIDGIGNKEYAMKRLDSLLKNYN